MRTSTTEAGKFAAATSRATTASSAMAATNVKLAGSLTQVVGNVSRYAAAMGAPTEALHALAAAEDAATLGIRNLSSAATGLPAALGLAGAAIAAVVTAVKLLKPAFDEAVAAAEAGGAKLPQEVQKVVDMAKEVAKAEAAIAATRQEIVGRFAAMDTVKVAERWRGIVEQSMAAGVSLDQIRDRYGKEMPDAINEWIKGLQRAESESKENERAAERAKEAWVRSAEAARREWDKFWVTLRGGPHDQEAHRISALLGARAVERADVNLALSPFPILKRGPDLSGVVGAFARGEITTGAQQAATKIDAVTDSTEKWVRALSVAAHAMSLLGIEADSTFGRILGQTASGAAMGAQIGGGIGAAIGAGIGFLSGVFGGGPSKEERERMRREEEARRQAIQDEARAMRSRGIEGLATVGPQFFMQRTITDASEAQRQGALFAAAWGQVVKEKGIVAAADAFRDAFAKMKADIEAAGIEAPAWMQAIGGQMELGLDERFRAIAEAARTAAEFLKAFAETGGILTPDTRGAFEQEARAAFQNAQTVAKELGKDDAEATKAGFAAANPILRALLDESIVSGATLSADIQELIRQSGIVPSVDVQQLDELRGIRRAVEALAGMGGGGGGGGNGGPPDWVHDIPSKQKGGRIEREPRTRTRDGGQLAILHPGETVVPDSEAEAFAQSVLGSGNAGSTSAALARIERELARPRDVTINLPAPDLRGAIIPRGGEDRFVQRAADEFARQVRQGGPIMREMLNRLDGRYAKR